MIYNETLNEKIPARLHVLLAQKSSQAIIIRRGPSKQVATIGWAEEGKIMSGRVSKSGLTKPNILFDANPLEFKEYTAPY